MPDTMPSRQDVTAKPLMHIILKDAQETQKFGRRIASLLRPRDVLALSGDLGTGKSTLARAIIQEQTGQDEVPSPTFTLVQTYERPNQAAIWHFDCYRLTQAEEAYELGIEDAFDEAICLIEWPEKLDNLLPSNSLWLVFKEMGESRQLDILGPQSWAERLHTLDLET